ncbi:MAG: hypothetical protein Q4D96_07300 [Propionibacteriaceae bacterium]|nr:hypothetical protein [Propionibacteriaceae bacterium]
MNPASFGIAIQPELDLPVVPRASSQRRSRRLVARLVQALPEGLEQPGFDFDAVADEVPVLERHGLRAMEHWRRHAPPSHRDVADPRRFFAELGKRLAHRIAQLAEPLERELPAGLTALERSQQVVRIRSQAEEAALLEQLEVIQQLSQAEEQRLGELLESLPASEMIEDELIHLEDQVAQSREMLGERDLTAAEEAARQQLGQLRELLAAAYDPGLEVSRRIAAAERAGQLTACWGTASRW